MTEIFFPGIFFPHQKKKLIAGKTLRDAIMSFRGTAAPRFIRHEINSRFSSRSSSISRVGHFGGGEYGLSLMWNGNKSSFIFVSMWRRGKMTAADGKSSFRDVDGFGVSVWRFDAGSCFMFENLPSEWVYWVFYVLDRVWVWG